MTDESSPVSETVAIDDMVEDKLGGVPSATSDIEAAPAQEAQPIEDAGAVSAEQPVTQMEAAPQGQAPQVTQPTPSTYRLGDREYTAQELQAALISAQQLPNLQKKYMEALESRQVAQQPQKPQEPTQPQVQPQQALQQIMAKYEPEAHKLVEQGLIEQDAVALFPKLVAQMLAYRDGFGQVTQAVQQIGSEIQATKQREQSTGLVNDIGRSLNALAESGDAFAPLKDPAKVQEYMTYLWNLNPQTVHLRNPDFLARQWIAFNKDQFLQNAQTQAAAQARNNQLRLARADATTGTRAPGGMASQPLSPLDEMVNDAVNRTL